MEMGRGGAVLVKSNLNKPGEKGVIKHWIER